MSDTKTTPPTAQAAGSERLKVAFRISRPLRNPDGLRDMRQTAKDWISTLMGALGDQLADGGDGTITTTIGGAEIEFSVTKIPGQMVTRTKRSCVGRCA